MTTPNTPAPLRAATEEALDMLDHFETLHSQACHDQATNSDHRAAHRRSQMKRAVMPIMGATLLAEIPWDFIAPHEAQAQRNHGQSLERLAQRGGLAVPEALDIVEGRPWASAKPCIENEHYLINKVREWRAATGARNEQR